MKNVFFITGTDTGVGKTLVTTAILHSVTQQGLSGYGLKPIAAGCENTEEGLRNEDAVSIQHHSSVSMPYSQVNPIALAAAKAPHIAAAEEGRRLGVDRIEGLVRGALMQRADVRLIEGAGGWRIPLNASEQFSQLPKRLGTQVILVVGLRLGCLNHALLTAEAIRADGLTIAGWVGSCIDADMPSIDENIATLRHCIPAPCLGVIPWLSHATAEHAMQHIDVKPLIA